MTAEELIAKLADAPAEATVMMVEASNIGEDVEVTAVEVGKVDGGPREVWLS